MRIEPHHYAALGTRAVQRYPELEGAASSPAEAALRLEREVCRCWGRTALAPGDQPWVPPQREWEAILCFACFLGESLRAAYGGKWRISSSRPDNPNFAELVLAERLVIYPVARLFRRFRNGDSNDLRHYVDEVARRLERAPPGPT